MTNKQRLVLTLQAVTVPPTSTLCFSDGVMLRSVFCSPVATCCSPPLVFCHCFFGEAAHVSARNDLIVE